MAQTLTVPAVFFRSKGLFVALPFSEFDGDEISILQEFDPFDETAY